MNSRHLLAMAALALLGAVGLRATPPVAVHDEAILADAMPRALSEFGFFADPALQRPAPGVHPYRLDTPLYSDGAEKLRFAYVPAGQAVGTANAYDGLHLVAQAIAQAGTTDGVKLRDALENLKEEYKGLIKNYKRPFTPEQHDALTDEDYVLVVWKGGKIVPVAMK